MDCRSEDKFKGHGVSACATCDGFFFRGQDVAVVGGGNTAVEEALFLTNFAASVTLIHRRDSLRAEKILQQRLFRNDRIKPLWNHTVSEILGNERPKSVTGVRVREVLSGNETTLACNGLFVAIGHTPASELVAGQLETRLGGYVVTRTRHCQDVHPRRLLRQAILWTVSTGRPSLQPAWDVWQPSMRKNSFPKWLRERRVSSTLNRNLFDAVFRSLTLKLYHQESVGQPRRFHLDPVSQNKTPLELAV